MRREPIVASPESPGIGSDRRAVRLHYRSRRDRRRLLPGRLALWQPPGIAVSQAGRVSASAGSGTGHGPGNGSRDGRRGSTGHCAGGQLTGFRPAARRRWSPTWQPARCCTRSNASSGFAPASTNKLATSIAALQVLGPSARFPTAVVAGAGAWSIVLVGGGDPTLAAGTPPASDYPQPATLLELARQTAAALRARGQHSVRLGYDTSLYTGPGLAPGWPASYVTTGNVSVITPLEADQGRVTHSRRACRQRGIQRAQVGQSGRAGGRLVRPLPGRRRDRRARTPSQVTAPPAPARWPASSRRRWPRSCSGCSRRATTSSPRTWPGTSR